MLSVAIALLIVAVAVFFLWKSQQSRNIKITGTILLAVVLIFLLASGYDFGNLFSGIEPPEDGLLYALL